MSCVRVVYLDGGAGVADEHVDLPLPADHSSGVLLALQIQLVS